MQTGVFARNPILRQYWYAVAQSSDVAPGPLAVTVLGEPLVLWHTFRTLFLGSRRVFRASSLYRPSADDRSPIVGAIPYDCLL